MVAIHIRLLLGNFVASLLLAWVAAAEGMQSDGLVAITEVIAHVTAYLVQPKSWALG